MKVELITKFEDFLHLEDAWNNLLEKSQNDIVFLRHEWFRCWWEAFGKNKTLFIVLLKNEESEIIGIAPLMISKDKLRGLPVRKLSFIRDDNAAHVDFIFTDRKKEALKRTFQYLKENKNLWDVAILESILKESDSCMILPDILAYNGLFFSLKEQHSSPFISLTSDWDTYFSKRSSKFRKTLRNELNRLNRSGRIAIEEINNINLSNVLVEITNISARSWKGKEKSDMGKSKENLQFFSTLSKMASEKGWLSIWLLRQNDKTIAMEYHLKYKNKIFALRGDFDEEYRYLSPGSVLDYNIVRHMFQSRVSEYDMCGGSYEYKMRWTSTTRRHCLFYIFHNNFYSYALHTLKNKFIPFFKKSKYIIKAKNFPYQLLQK